MIFTRLRLIGFKSFVDTGEFDIESGLTGVVGPNGCGKSNLVEALRWVMGESSYKNMRASGMDDVIFSGSGKRPSRSTAEVTLFLDNVDRSAPPLFNDADELQVTRRIERERGSVYRVNGKEVRARDVQLLFADQSTGARSPSMVGQGRIGELIQAKPQARRALLEEAAGVSGLHSRRHEAELRLRSAEQNLGRLEDVVGELSAQIESLRRQSRQALRFKTLSGEIRALEALLLHVRWTAAKTVEAEANTALTRATVAVAERANLQMNAAREQVVGVRALPGLREAGAAAGGVVQRLSIEQAQVEDDAKRAAGRLAELTLRLSQLSSDMVREERLVRDDAAVVSRLDAEATQLAAEEEGADDRAYLAQQAADLAASRLILSENILSEVTGQRAEALALIGHLDQAVRYAENRRDRLDDQAAALRRDVAAISKQISGLSDPAAKKSTLDEAEIAVVVAEDAAVAAERAVIAARAAEQAARPPVQDARTAMAGIDAEAKAVNGLMSGGRAGRFAPVIDQIEVQRGFETALAAALGDDLQISTDAHDPAYWTDIAAFSQDPDLPHGVPRLNDVMMAPRALARRLNQVGIVEEADGARLQPMLSAGQRLVSRSGSMWRWDGLTVRADASSAAALRLSQKNRLLELAEEAATTEKRIDAARMALARAERVLADALDAEKNARKDLLQRQVAVREARDGLSRAERASGDLAVQRDALVDSVKRAADDLAEAERVVLQACEQRRSASDPTRLQAAFEAASARVAEDRERAAESRLTVDAIRREANARAIRLDAIRVERAAWTARARNAEMQIEALAARRAEALAEKTAVADMPEQLDRQRRALMTERIKAEGSRKDAADRLQAAENRQIVLDKAASATIQALASAREERGRIEERFGAASGRRLEIEARILETLKVLPHLALDQAGIKTEAPLPELDNLEKRLEWLRAERERLGAVNLRAEEENSELSSRLETIVSDREDVVQAIKALRQAIHSLNKEGRERLLEAFGAVNDHFRRLFTHLFGGGIAELQLIESDDPLEAGLEILARPPGKKPQTMTLLSGGEQALTAMALIFAVFLTNPAPICVLDEVDAPLDDHNVERYCNLMDEMARTTQTRFVIITHNPITMARMDRLFGVTMAEQGVSQLVSVDLRGAERLREAS